MFMSCSLACSMYGDSNEQVHRKVGGEHVLSMEYQRIDIAYLVKCKSFVN